MEKSPLVVILFGDLFFFLTYVRFRRVVIRRKEEVIIERKFE
jgi:hypothetical protein